MSNLELWNRVCDTDPKYTKPGTKSGNNFTAISPQYQRMMATQVFGPYGQDWGVSGEKWERFEFQDNLLCQYNAILWYWWEGNKYEINIQSAIKIAYTTNAGKLKIDDDYAKKVTTDALTKGLSYLGFNADVFMGMFDDNKYVQNRTREELIDDVVTIDKTNRYLEIIEEWDYIGMYFFDRELRAETNYSNENTRGYVDCISKMQNSFEKGTKTKNGKAHRALVDDCVLTFVNQLTAHANNEDKEGVLELVEDLTPVMKKEIIKELSPNTIEYIKGLK